MPNAKGELLEVDIEDPACKHAEQRGVFHRKYQNPNRRSAPDRLYIYKGFTFYIEYKAPKKKPNPNQKLEITRMRTAGAHVYVIDNLEYAKVIINTYVAQDGVVQRWLYNSMKGMYSVF